MQCLFWDVQKNVPVCCSFMHFNVSSESRAVVMQQPLFFKREFLFRGDVTLKTFGTSLLKGKYCIQAKEAGIKLMKYRQWTHVRTYGTDVFAMDMLSSIFQASGDKLMKPMAFYCVFILALRRILPDF